jgi:phosphocarrier protein FPr
MNFLKKILNNSKVDEVELVVNSSSGFHLRPIAKFANETKKFKSKITIRHKGKEAVALDISKVLALSITNGDRFILRAEGSDASVAIRELKLLFDNMMVDDNSNYIPNSNKIDIEPIFGGLAIGKLFEYSHKSVVEDSKITISKAVELAKDELYRLSLDDKSKESQIFLAQKELLDSIALNNNFLSVDDFIEEIDKNIKILETKELKSKIVDYKDIKQRVLSYLGVKNVLVFPEEDAILVADDILPQDVKLIKNSRVKGVILKYGSITSHSSILLRSANIPSLILNREIDKKHIGDLAILDSTNKQITLSPTKDELDDIKRREESLRLEIEDSFDNRFEIVKTRFGKKIKILANITDLKSAKDAKEFGADGVGLLRTEFLFMEKRPTLDEQIKHYRAIFNLFDDITVRTLDIGGDKSLPYVSIPAEDNPFLGLRGIRFSLFERELFREQLLAIFKAHDDKPIKIMFPMVSQKEEFVEAKRVAQDVARESGIDISNIKFGIMLEVPSVILAIKIFDREVDFYSIGTNDLTQYLFAIDRTHSSLKVNSLSPILISALKIIIDTTKKPVSICGELAGIDEAVEVLVNIGYDTLSISPKLIPQIKSRIRSI